MGTAMTYIQSTPLESEDSYPYEAYTDSCQLDASKEVEGDNGPVGVNPNSSSALRAAIAEGPVSVAIEADQDAF